MRKFESERGGYPTITYAATIARAPRCAQGTARNFCKYYFGKALGRMLRGERCELSKHLTSVAGACFELCAQLRTRILASLDSLQYLTIYRILSKLFYPWVQFWMNSNGARFKSKKPKRTCLVRLVKSSTQEVYPRAHVTFTVRCRGTSSSW